MWGVVLHRMLFFSQICSINIRATNISTQSCCKIVKAVILSQTHRRAPRGNRRDWIRCSWRGCSLINTCVQSQIHIRPLLPVNTNTLRECSCCWHTLNPHLSAKPHYHEKGTQPPFALFFSCYVRQQSRSWCQRRFTEFKQQQQPEKEPMWFSSLL